MSLVELIVGTAVCGYLALTLIGVVTTTSIVTFIDGAVGRKLQDPDPPWYYTFLGLLYLFMYMWAIGLVASQEGGKLNLTLGRVKHVVENGGLSVDEVVRLREACNILKETSRF